MIIWELIGFLLLLLAILLTIQLGYTSFLVNYLIQLKEYRLDRLIAYLKTVSGKKQLLSIFNLFDFLKWKKFYRPKFTFRILLTFIILAFCQYRFFFFSLILFYKALYSWQKNILLSIILSLSFIVWLTPLFCLMASLLIEVVLIPLKFTITYFAYKKIKKMNNLLVIGITGSYGKTTTKEMIAFLLDPYFKVLKTPLNCNTKIGIAMLVLRNLKFDHQIFIVEMGAYRKGEIADICQMVGPKVGIITGVNEQHFQLFGSLENIINTKYELIQSLPANSMSFFNIKDRKVFDLGKKTKKPKIYYGYKKIPINISLTAFWHQEAIQAAWTIGKYLKLSEKDMVKRLIKFKGLPTAIKIIKGISGVKIIDDSYNSNPKGFVAALQLLENTKADKKILITNGISELGDKAEEIHQKIARKAALICQRIILTKEDHKQVFLKEIKKIDKSLKLEFEEDLVKIIDSLKLDLNKKTLILIEGRVLKGLKEALL